MTATLEFRHKVDFKTWDPWNIWSEWCQDKMTKSQKDNKTKWETDRQKDYNTMNKKTKRHKYRYTEVQKDKDQKESPTLWSQGSFALLRCFVCSVCDKHERWCTLCTASASRFSWFETLDQHKDGAKILFNSNFETQACWLGWKSDLMAHIEVCLSLHINLCMVSHIIQCTTV